VKRSNRLVVVGGVLLAVASFMLIIVSLQAPPTGTPDASSSTTTTTMVVAAKDLPLGTKLAPEALTVKIIQTVDKPADSFPDPALIVGKTIRQPVSAGAYITTAMITGNSPSLTGIEVPAGFVGISIRVDQVNGVGTLIKPGDFVDVITGITTADRMPLMAWGIDPKTGTAGWVKVDDSTYSHTSVKTLVQGLMVLSTLTTPGADTGANAGTAGTTINGSEEIVIVAATSQQAEVIKFSQMDGNISLVLRSAADCRGADGTSTTCPDQKTTGVTLRTLVNDFGVVPPQLVEVIQPKAK
jgi:pilus assembly protein CpaB